MTKSILQLFPAESRAFWERAAAEQENLQEIRLRVGQPVCIYGRGREWFPDKSGTLQEDPESGVKISAGELERILQHICQYSLYAYEEELQKGYLTADGGHRIGVAGQAVYGERGTLKTLKNISFLNIRIAHEIKGAADGCLKGMYERGRLKSTLLISPPGVGKTTLLRDLIRRISDGNPYGAGMNVGVVDERSEIAGSFLGVPQLDVGMRTDVMDACPKLAGMMMLLRSMSPKVLAIDELGDEEELRCLMSASACGIKVLATAHGEDFSDVERRFGIGAEKWKTVFDRCLVLSPASDRAGVQVTEEEFPDA